MNRKVLLRVGLFFLVMLIGAITVSDAVAAVEDPTSDPRAGLGPPGPIVPVRRPCLTTSGQAATAWSVRTTCTS